MGRPGGVAGPVLAHYRDAKRFYRFPLSAPWAHLVLIGTLLVVLLFLAPKVWRHSQAERLALLPTLENLQRAVALEPDRAEYRDQLGRIYLFSLSNYDPQRAAESLQRAVELNPAVAEYWLDLATAYDSLGRKKDSVECVETARRHDPLNPQIAWATGNVRAEAGDLPGAMEAWRQAILEQPDQLGVGLDLAWKIAPDTQILLDHLVPPTNESDFFFLNFLARGKMGKPELVWNRIIARGQPFPPGMARVYLQDFLLRDLSSPDQRRKVETAEKVWSQLMHMIATSKVSPEDGEAETRPPDGGESKRVALDGAGESGGQLRLDGAGDTGTGNLMQNGGFESEILNMGFDWIWDAPQGATLLLDQRVFQEGRRSARIDFDGSESLIFVGLRHLVPVEPGHHYRLTSYLRGEGIKGGVGIRLEVAEAWVNEITEPLAHGREVFQTAGWVPDSIEFTVPPKTYVLSVRVLRDLRGIHKSRLSGVFWLDNAVLQDIGSSPPRGAP
jgi:tetratricopeptide (TPR) repeat protein